MKTLVKTSVIVLSLLTIFSCKEKNDETTDVTTVEEVSEIGFPNESDIHFDNAITALESNNAKKAAEELSKGVKTLSVDTPKIRAVSLIIKFTEYDTKKVYPEVQDQGGIGSLERAA